MDGFVLGSRDQLLHLSWIPNWSASKQVGLFSFFSIFNVGLFVSVSQLAQVSTLAIVIYWLTYLSLNNYLTTGPRETASNVSRDLQCSSSLENLSSIDVLPPSGLSRSNQRRIPVNSGNQSDTWVLKTTKQACLSIILTDSWQLNAWWQHCVSYYRLESQLCHYICLYACPCVFACCLVGSLKLICSDRNEKAPVYCFQSFKCDCTWTKGCSCYRPTLWPINIDWFTWANKQSTKW